MVKNNITLVVIQKDDFKSRMWGRAALGHKIEIISVPGSPISAPFFFLKHILSGRRPNAYVARYLNDYPSFCKTLLRFASELLLIIILQLTKAKLFWICHNVDRETERNFPKISNMRRALMASFANKIFVTDRSLVAIAKKYFPKHTHKIDFITFGSPAEVDSGNGDAASIEFITIAKSRAIEIGFRFLSVLCAGSPGANVKSLHFSNLINLIEAAKLNGFYLAVVIAGNWRTDSDSRKLLNEFKDHPQIIVYEGYTKFSTNFIRQYVNFYFRGYSDFSVPFTVYESCYLHKPILALNAGFLPQMVEDYGVGIVTDFEFSNVRQDLSLLSETSFRYNFSRFIEENNWNSLVQKIATVLNGREKGSF